MIQLLLYHFPENPKRNGKRSEWVLIGTEINTGAQTQKKLTFSDRLPPLLLVAHQNLTVRPWD